MKNTNTYSNQNLGFFIRKPRDWVFIPPSWAVNLKCRYDLSDEEFDYLKNSARLPFVYFHYDHRLTNQAVPAVQAMYRPLVSPGTMNLPTLLQLQITQLACVFDNFILEEATSDGIISGRPANIIKSTFTVHNSHGSEFECLSRCYLILAERFMFVVEMSGPVEGEFRCDKEFKEILTSIRIE